MTNLNRESVDPEAFSNFVNQKFYEDFYDTLLIVPAEAFIARAYRIGGNSYMDREYYRIPTQPHNHPFALDGFARFRNGQVHEWSKSAPSNSSDIFRGDSIAFSEGPVLKNSEESNLKGEEVTSLAQYNSGRLKEIDLEGSGKNSFFLTQFRIEEEFEEMNESAIETRLVNGRHQFIIARDPRAVNLQRIVDGEIVDDLIYSRIVDFDKIQRLFPEELKADPFTENLNLDRLWRSTSIKQEVGFQRRIVLPE